MSSVTSDKGTIGELAVTIHLIELGYEVYKGVTGSEPIDLVAFKNDRFIRVQVKSRVVNAQGAVGFPRLSGGYRHEKRLNGTEFDVMAMYLRDTKTCLFMSMKELIQNEAVTLVRVIAPKNGAKKNIRLSSEYCSFERAMQV